MVKTGGLWRTISQNYTAVKNTNTKLVKYSCNYCAHKYAFNVTRMTGHILSDCPNCPQQVKNEIYRVCKSPNTAQQRVRKHGTNTRWMNIAKHYSKIRLEANEEEVDKYKCSYCGKSFSCNITKMTEHILECNSCPEIAKKALDSLNTSQQTEDTFTFENIGMEESNFPTASTSTSGSFDEIKIEMVYSDKADESLSEDVDCNNEQEIWNSMAKACFATNTSVKIFENEHWKEVFAKINPILQLPPPGTLIGFLDKEYDCMNAVVQQKIKEAKTIGLQVHGLNRQRSPVIVVLTTPQPFVYKVLEAEDRNSDNLIKIIIDIIKDIYPNRILSIITDNLNICWEGLESNAPNCGISPYVCNLHILKLLKKDILHSEIFQKTFFKCLEVLEEVKSNSNSCQFQDEDGNLFPLSKNLNKIETCINNFVSNCHVLKKLAEKGVLNKTKRDISSQSKFWPNMRTLRQCLYHLNLSKKEMKQKFVCPSSVVQYYFDLKDKFEEVFKNSYIPEEECNEIMNNLDKYKKCAVQDVHKAASLLNPNYMGANLSDEDCIDAIAYINKLAKILPGVKSENIMFDIAAYRSKQGIWGKDFVWDSLKIEGGKGLPPIIWWQSMCASTEICKVAVAILNCPATLAYLSDSKIQKCRNETDQKLIFVNHNLRLLAKENVYNNQNAAEYWSNSESSDSDDEFTEADDLTLNKYNRKLFCKIK